VSGELVRRRWLVVAVVLSLGGMGELQAQPASPPSGATVAFTAGASLGDGDPALALSAGLGVRLSRRLGLEFELAYARALDFTLDLCPAPLVCVLGGRFPVTGRTVSLVPYLVVELLPPSSRWRVHVLAGVGAGHVRQRYLLDPPFTGAVTPVEFTRSSLTAAFSFGGGATARIAPRLSFGVDVRSLHLRDDDARPERFITPAGTLSTLRVGSRVSWRF
jgi:hypothetical protein